jgi:hypothetical protein
LLDIPTNLWGFAIGLGLASGIGEGALSLDTETAGKIDVAWQYSWRACPLLSYIFWAWGV